MAARDGAWSSIARLRAGPDPRLPMDPGHPDCGIPGPGEQQAVIENNEELVEFRHAQLNVTFLASQSGDYSAPCCLQRAHRVIPSGHRCRMPLRGRRGAGVPLLHHDNTCTRTFTVNSSDFIRLSIIPSSSQPPVATMTTESKPPFPPFTRETAQQKVKAAQAAWNTK